MRHIIVGAALLATASAAHAAPVYLATGSLTGFDLSGLTNTLEDGTKANLLGGLGSGLAYAGGNTFIAVPDRGPNATTYNPGVDNTTSYIARFQTINLALTPTNAGNTAFTLTPNLQATTLLYSTTALNYGAAAGLPNGAPAQNTANKFYFTGRSDNYGAGNSLNPSNARLDPEGVRVSPDGTKVYISDEYGPYVYEFDRATGERLRSFTLPSSGAGNLAITNLNPVGATEIANNNTSGRVTNKGLEGLAITPDGKTLYAILQAPAAQDAAITASKNTLRIAVIDIASGLTTKEIAYNLTTGSGVSELVAIDANTFLVDERDGKGLGDGTNAVNKRLYRISVTGATDVSNLSGAALAAAAVTKTEVLNLVQQLTTAAGLTPAQIPSKIEGVAFGADVLVGTDLLHTLIITNDNDFSAGSGPNNFYAFGISDTDLGAILVNEFAVPEPASIAVFGAGLLALIRRRRPRS